MDQRDIQAAIKSCKDRIKSITSVPDYQPGKRHRKRAIELECVKIAALALLTQEQAERAAEVIIKYSESEDQNVCHIS